MKFGDRVTGRGLFDGQRGIIVKHSLGLPYPYRVQWEGQGIFSARDDEVVPGWPNEWPNGEEFK